MYVCINVYKGDFIFECMYVCFFCICVGMYVSLFLCMYIFLFVFLYESLQVTVFIFMYIC